MGFDIGDGDGHDKNPSGENFGKVRLMTAQQIAERTERMTRDEQTGEPLIVLPSDSPLGEAVKLGMMHGACRHFSLQQGQDQCHREQFWQRIMREEGYRESWFENPATYGFCPYFEGRLMSAFHPATVSAEDLDSSLHNQKGALDKKLCPYYESKRVRGSTMVMGAHFKSNLEH